MFRKKTTTTDVDEQQPPTLDEQPTDVEQDEQPPADDTPHDEDAAAPEGAPDRDPDAEVARLREQLWRERVAATGLLIDPEAMPLDVDLIDDPDGIRAAATDLVARKPYLRANPTTSDVGQHDRASDTPFSLSAALRAASI